MTDPAEALENYFECEMRASEHMQDFVESTSGVDERESIAESVIDDVIGRIDEDMNRLKVYKVGMDLGKAIGSEALVKACHAKAKEINSGGQ